MARGDFLNNTAKRRAKRERFIRFAFLFQFRNLLIGDVETVAEKLVGEIRATHPVHICFSFKVGNTEHKAAMRSMELMMQEVKPRVEKALA